MKKTKPKKLLKKVSSKKEDWFKEREKKYKISKWMPYEQEISEYYYLDLVKWIKKKNRKCAEIEFTAGLQRNIARLMDLAYSVGFVEGCQETAKGIFKDFDREFCHIEYHTYNTLMIFKEDLRKLKKKYME